MQSQLISHISGWHTQNTCLCWIYCNGNVQEILYNCSSIIASAIMLLLASPSCSYPTLLTLLEDYMTPLAAIRLEYFHFAFHLRGDRKLWLCTVDLYQLFSYKTNLKHTMTSRHESSGPQNEPLIFTIMFKCGLNSYAQKCWVFDLRLLGMLGTTSWIPAWES